MEDYDFASSHVLIYHVPVYDYGEILIDIRRVPFSAYDHVILNLVCGGMRNDPNNETVDPVVVDFQHIIERRQRRLRRRHRNAPVNGLPVRRVYVSRNILGIGAGIPIDLLFRQPNREQNLAEERANGVQQSAEDEGQGFAEPQANPDFINGEQAPLGNRMFFQHYLVNEGEVSHGFLYRFQQGAVNGEQMPMDHSGDYQQAPGNVEQNAAGARVLNRHVVVGGGQAFAGIFGGQAARGRVVVQIFPDQDGRISGRQNVRLDIAEDNEEQNQNSAIR